MTTVRETSAEIDTAAADWVARLNRGALTRDERAALDAWAAADPRRAGALARAMAVMARVDQLIGPAPAPARTTRLGRREMFLGGGALAASFAAAAIVAPRLWVQRRTLTAARGEVKIAMLPDGSRVTLNSDSEVRAELHGNRRDVTLVRGEALFDVAKDARRPFVVRARDLDVRAIGTSFAVRMPARGVRQVLVREGFVEVSRPTEAPQRLRPGCWATAPDDRDIHVIHYPVARIRAALAWAGDCGDHVEPGKSGHSHSV